MFPPLRMEFSVINEVDLRLFHPYMTMKAEKRRVLKTDATARMLTSNT